jgi:hypothetical protein
VPNLGAVRYSSGVWDACANVTSLLCDVTSAGMMLDGVTAAVVWRRAPRRFYHSHPKPCRTTEGTVWNCEAQLRDIDGAQCSFFDRTLHSRMALGPTTSARLEASMRVINGIPLGCPLPPLTITPVKSVQTLKANVDGINTDMSLWFSCYVSTFLSVPSHEAWSEEHTSAITSTHVHVPANMPSLVTANTYRGCQT